MEGSAARRRASSGGGGGGGGAGQVAGDAAVCADEELAMAFFHQFAMELEEQLGTPIPEEVRGDPVRYEEFVRTHFQRQMERGDPELEPPRGGQSAEPERRPLNRRGCAR